MHTFLWVVKGSLCQNSCSLVINFLTKLKNPKVKLPSKPAFFVKIYLSQQPNGSNSQETQESEKIIETVKIRKTMENVKVV